MSTPAATLDILIDVRAKLDALLESQERFRQAREEAQGFGTMLKTGLGIDLARRGLDLLNNTLRSTVAAAVQMADALQDTSENLGISASALQVLVGAGKEAGAEMNVVVQALNHLRRSTIEARDGTGQLSTEFANLGLNAAAVAELPLQQQMEAIGQAIYNAADQGAAFNSAMQILGSRNAPQLISMLRRLGKDGFGVLSTEIRQSMGVMSDETVKKLADVKDRWEAIQNQAVVAAGEIAADNKIPETIEWLLKAAVIFGKGVAQFRDGVGRTAAALVYGRQAVRDADEADRLAREAEEAQRISNLPPPDTSQRDINNLNLQRIFNQASIDRLRVDTSMPEAQRRRELLGALQQERDLLQQIVQITAEKVKLSADGNTTEADLKKLSEQYKMIAQLNALDASIYELGETPLSRSRRAAGEVNDPSANPNATGLGAGLGIGALDWATSLGSRSEQVALLMNDTLGNAVRGISDGIYGWVTGTGDFGDALLDIGDTILRRLLDTIIEMGVQWVITGGLAKMTMTSISALGSLLRKKEAAETLATEAAKTPALMTNAAAASASSFGMSAVIGLALLAALMAAFGGFADGGYTGPGGKNDVAGVVHRGEVVFSQADISRLGGLGVVEGLRTAGVAAPSVPSPVLSNGAGAAAANGRPARTILVDDRNPDLIDQMMNDPRFENHLQRIVRGNPGAFGIST